MNHHDTKQCVRSPPKPFITSTIQQKCSTLYHISPKKLCLFVKVYMNRFYNLHENR